MLGGNLKRRNILNFRKKIFFTLRQSGRPEHLGDPPNTSFSCQKWSNFLLFCLNVVFRCVQTSDHDTAMRHGVESCRHRSLLVLHGAGSKQADPFSAWYLLGHKYPIAESLTTFNNQHSPNTVNPPNITPSGIQTNHDLSGREFKACDARSRSSGSFWPSYTHTRAHTSLTAHPQTHPSKHMHTHTHTVQRGHRGRSHPLQTER